MAYAAFESVMTNNFDHISKSKNFLTLLQSIPLLWYEFPLISTKISS